MIFSYCSRGRPLNRRLVAHLNFLNFICNGRLIDEENLMDALALSDRCLRKGASDHLLKLLIECGEDNPSLSGQSQGNGLWSNSWQYCLRLKDKQLAAKLALRYLYMSDF